METVYPLTKAEDHVTRFNHLASELDDLAALSEAEKQRSEERSRVVAEDFAEGLARIDDAFDRVGDLLTKGAARGQSPA